jgi:hypothetical protein
MLFLNRYRKNELIHKELQYFLSNRLLLSSQRYGFGIRDPNPGSRGQKGNGSATLKNRKRVKGRNIDNS